MANWYYAVGTQTQGPVSAEDLRAMATRGDLTPTSYVIREGATDWQPLGEVEAELTLQRTQWGGYAEPPSGVNPIGGGPADLGTAAPQTGAAASPAEGGWGAPQQPASGGWGTPQPSDQGGWTTPQPTAAETAPQWGQAPPQPDPNQGGWGSAVPPQNQGGWGQAPPQADPNQGGWGQAPPQNQGGWGQAPPQPDPNQGGWGQAPPQDQGGWGANPAGGLPAWGGQQGWSSDAAYAGPYAVGAGGPGGAAYAEWWQRLLAKLIDIIIVGIPGVVLFWAVAGQEIRDRMDRNGNSFSFQYGGRSILGQLLWYVIGLAYFAVLNGQGQTLGKKILGIKVVQRGTGAPIGLGKGILRHLTQFLANFVCFGAIYILIDGLSPLWDSEKRALHDKIGGSVVVKAR